MREFTVKFESIDRAYLTNVKISNYYTGDNGVLKTPTLSESDPDKREFSVICKCDYKERKGTAKIYNDFVNGNKKHMMHSLGGDNPPNSMYLNFKLEFTLNGTNYTAYVGMNSYGKRNRWNFCSPYLVADSSEKVGYLNDLSQNATLYEIKPSGSNTFNISVYD